MSFLAYLETIWKKKNFGVGNFVKSYLLHFSRFLPQIWSKIIVQNTCFWNFGKIPQNGHFWISGLLSAIMRKRAPRGPRWPDFALTYTKIFLFYVVSRYVKNSKIGPKNFSGWPPLKSVIFIDISSKIKFFSGVTPKYAFLRPILSISRKWKEKEKKWYRLVSGQMWTTPSTGSSECTSRQNFKIDQPPIWTTQVVHNSEILTRDHPLNTEAGNC